MKEIVVERSKAGKLRLLLDSGFCPGESDWARKSNSFIYLFLRYANSLVGNLVRNLF